MAHSVDDDDEITVIFQRIPTSIQKAKNLQTKDRKKDEPTALSHSEASTAILDISINAAEILDLAETDFQSEPLELKSESCIDADVGGENESCLENANKDLDSVIDIKHESLDMISHFDLTSYDEEAQDLNLRPNGQHQYVSYEAKSVAAIASTISNSYSAREISLLEVIGEYKLNYELPATAQQVLPGPYIISQVKQEPASENLGNLEAQKEGTLKAPAENCIENLLQCPSCVYRDYTVLDLIDHSVIHNDFQLYQCLCCCFKNKFRCCIIGHMLTQCQNDGFGSLEIFCNDFEIDIQGDLFNQFKKCCTCNYNIDDKDSLKIHLLSHSHVMFICYVCNYESLSQEDLRGHLLSHCETKGNIYCSCNLHLVRDFGMVFKCFLCTYKTQNKTKLQNHLLICNFKIGQRNKIILRITNPVPNNLPKVKMSVQLSNSKEQNLTDTNHGAIRSGNLRPLAVRNKIQQRKTSESTFPILSVKELREVLWCHTYVTHKRFRKNRIGAKMKDLLLQRGNIDREIIRTTPFSWFRKTLWRIRRGLTEISKEELDGIKNEVDEYIRCKDANGNKNVVPVIQAFWSEKEKWEILWCYTYATHMTFSKRGVRQRTKEMLLERGNIDKHKIKYVPEGVFTRVAFDVREGGGPSYNNQIKMINMEVDRYLAFKEEQRRKEIQNWTLKRNEYYGELLKEK